MNSRIEYLLNLYRNRRKQQFLGQPASYKNKYAIIGTGQHNTSNIYPCLWHLGAPVTKICSRNLLNAEKAATRWPGCTGTDNIDEILKNTSIAGVIVCTGGEFQADITKKLLENNKHVFVEKPIGFSTEELKSVIAVQKNNICQVGLQRRFAPVTLLLKKHCKNIITYNYRFYTGAYPEGDSVYDIFIHPVDHVIQLFGKATIEHISLKKTNAAETYFLILNHNGIKGNIELSTSYSWQQSADEMSVNTTTKIFSATYPGHLSSVLKQATISTIPLEKIFHQPSVKHIYLDNSGFMPEEKMNTLQLQGFYPELKNFVVAVEKNKVTDLERLESLLPAYEILEKIKNTV